MLKDMCLKDSIEINASPEKVFDFLVNLVDDASYHAWHSRDHVAMRWLKGDPWQEGSIVFIAERIHGKLLKLVFEVIRVEPDREIEYAPQSEALRIYFPKNRFLIEPTDNGCTFTTELNFRIGKLARTFASAKLEAGLDSVRKHLKEESENLKKAVEGE